MIIDKLFVSRPSGEEQKEVTRKGFSLISNALESKGWKVTEKLHKIKSSYGIEKQDKPVIKTVRMRSLSKKDPVPMGRSLKSYDEDFLIVCRNVIHTPEMFVLTMEEALQKVSKKIKSGSESYWIEPPDYKEFLDNWDALQ